MKSHDLGEALQRTAGPAADDPELPMVAMPLLIIVGAIVRASRAGAHARARSFAAFTAFRFARPSCKPQLCRYPLGDRWGRLRWPA